MLPKIGKSASTAAIIPEETNKNGFLGMGIRHFVAIMALLGVFNVYTMRIGLSVAIVAMVVSSPKNKTSSSAEDVCPFPEGILAGQSANPNSTLSQNAHKFNWSPKTQGEVLGAYFYGYIVTQIFAGWLARKYGGKRQFGLGILACSVLTLLTPVSTRVHYGLLMAIRILEGLVTGLCYPAMQHMVAQWSPVLERTKLSTLANVGAPIGNVVVFLTSGFLADNLGWESIFYVFGSIGAVWWLFWHFLIYDSPQTHPRISQYEKTLITGQSAHVPDLETANLSASKNSGHTPWKKILTALPVWAMILAHFGQNWGNYTLLTNLPTYMNKILHFNLSANGTFSALPYIALWVVSIASGHIADFFRRRGYLSTTAVRKVFNTIGNVIPAIALVSVGYVDCDWMAAIALLTIATGISGTTQCSFQVNSIDLSAAYASLIYGISNTIANVPGIISPYTVGLITDGENDSGHTMSNWRVIFYISGGIRLGTAIFYAIFASGEDLNLESAGSNMDTGAVSQQKQGLETASQHKESETL